MVSMVISEFVFREVYFQGAKVKRESEMKRHCCVRSNGFYHQVTSGHTCWDPMTCMEDVMTHEGSRLCRCGSCRDSSRTAPKQLLSGNEAGKADFCLAVITYVITAPSDQMSSFDGSSGMYVSTRRCPPSFQMFNSIHHKITSAGSGVYTM